MEIHIAIEIDGVDYTVHAHDLTGAQIKTLANVPMANLLYRIDGKKRELIANDEVVHLHEHEKFVTAPPVGGAS